MKTSNDSEVFDGLDEGQVYMSKYVSIPKKDHIIGIA